MDVKSFIQDYLSKMQLMLLSTSSGNQPWVTPVYYAFDANLNLYWLSNSEKRHSKELEKNPKVGGAIVVPHNYGDKVRGLQFEGEARKLAGEELEMGINIYTSRFWIVEDRTTENNGRHTCYQLKPKIYYLYDEINFPSAPGQVLKL